MCSEKFTLHTAAAAATAINNNNNNNNVLSRTETRTHYLKTSRFFTCFKKAHCSIEGIKIRVPHAPIKQQQHISAIHFAYL